MMENTLYYGDNLDILREHIADESVDLIYLDPPFNSNRSYNVLFRDESGRESDAQITAFEDTWGWQPDTEALYIDLVTGSDERLVRLLSALVGGKDEPGLLGRNQVSAYLVMMAARLAELKRVLKPTGSLYLHCDSTASHYLKLVLDAIFLPTNFRNELIWKRATSTQKGSQHKNRQWGRNTDTLLYYGKSDQATLDPLRPPDEMSEDELMDKFNLVDENGRRYYDDSSHIWRTPGMGERPNLCYEWRGFRNRSPAGWRLSRERLEEEYQKGNIVIRDDGKLERRKYIEDYEGATRGNLWVDIDPVQGKERLNFQTQKPLDLLERIIKASSNPGDVFLDPFCGCGTAIDAAQNLDRRWLGIDITHLSIALLKYRLQHRHGLRAGDDYRVIGEPQDLAGARNLAEKEKDGRYQFEWWALSLVGARPLGASGSGRRGKKGADGGVDGVIHFVDVKGKTHRIVVQVKSGKVSRRDIGDLRGLLDGGATMALFITLEPPTGPMKVSAMEAGYYETGSDVQPRLPRLQILTIEQLLAGERPELPGGMHGFRQAPRARGKRDAQGRLL